MNEYRATLQALVDDNIPPPHPNCHVCHPRYEYLDDSFSCAYHDAKALLARPEPEPSNEIARLENLIDMLSWPEPTFDDREAAAAAIRELINLRKSQVPKLEAVALLSRPESPTQTLYVFLQQRPSDKQPWPLVYTDQSLAEAAPHRVTPVVVVNVPMPTDQEAQP